MHFMRRMATTPLWLLMPAIAVVALIASVVASYTPLVFDPDSFVPAQASAAELRTIDASQLEKSEGTPAGDVEIVEPAASNVAGKLADGVWVGYAACGRGNVDGWKPYYVAVSVEVSGGKSLGISDIWGTSVGDAGSAALSWDASENQAYLDWAIYGKGSDAGIRDQIARQVSVGAVSAIDTVSGATYSSAAIFNAYIDALNKSASAAGAQSVEAAPTAPTPQDAPEEQGENIGVSGAPDISELADGEWVGYAACGIGNEDGWKPYYIAVTVSIAGGEVTDITDVKGTSQGDDGDEALNWDARENQAYLTWAVDGRTRGAKNYVGIVAQIRASIELQIVLSSIDVVSGATYCSTALVEAYFDALGKAARAAGSVYDAPDVSDLPSGNGGSDSQDEAAVGDTQLANEPLSLAGDYTDGTYTASSFCEDEDAPSAYSPYYLFVTIEVENGRISRIVEVRPDSEGEVDPSYIYDAHENDSYFYRAVNGLGPRSRGVVSKIQSKLDASADTVEIDTVSGATWTSKSIYRAFADAAKQARAENGQG